MWGCYCGKSNERCHVNISETNLTSPQPLSVTPLNPSRPLVQALRSPGFSLLLLQQAEERRLWLVPVSSAVRIDEMTSFVLGFHLSFSHNSTSFISARQCLSSKLSSSISLANLTVRTFRQGLIIRSRSDGISVDCVNGWVRKNGDHPMTRNVERRGIKYTTGRRAKKDTRATDSRMWKCWEEYVIWCKIGRIASWTSEL